MRVVIKNTIISLPDEVALSLIRDGVAVPFQKTTHDPRESSGLQMRHSQEQATVNKPHRLFRDLRKKIAK